MIFHIFCFCWFNCQVVPLTAAVIVTTPQKLAFIDVAKGVRMFSKLKVCFYCVIWSVVPSTMIRKPILLTELKRWHAASNYTFHVQVPCVAVVENMCHFDADGKRYYPFGRGSGSQVCRLVLRFYWCVLLLPESFKNLFSLKQILSKVTMVLRSRNSIYAFWNDFIK